MTGRIRETHLLVTWNGRTTRLLLVTGWSITLVADDVTEADVAEVAKAHGLPVDVRPGAYR